jgi:hypothetical protein
MAVTLVVEDGTGIAGANSYVAATFADTYNEARGRSAWALLDAEAKAIALIKATEALDALYPWIGTKASRLQGLQWPRHQGVDSAGESVLLIDRDGFDIEGVPIAVQNATAEAAYQISSGEELFQDTDPRGKVIRKKTDVLETEYQPDTPATKPAAPTVFGALNALLKGLYVQPNGGMVIGTAVRA